MLKKIFLIGIILLFVDCLTVGKVGYVAPAEKDVEPVPTQVVGEFCALVVVDMLDNLNSQLKSQNVTSLKGTTLVFKQGFFSKNCLHATK